MQNATLTIFEQTPAPASAGFVRPAQVIEELRHGGFAVAMEYAGRSHRLQAQTALPESIAIGTGVRVLVTGETLDQCYIIGVLSPPAMAASAGRGFSTRGGASARLVEKDGEDGIEVRDAEDRIVFAYDADSGSGTLTVPGGDLKLHAPNGNIDLLSGKGIRCRGETVELAGVGRDTAAAATLALGQGVAELSSPEVKVAAEHAEIAIRESTYRGDRLTVTVKQAKQIFGKLETVATRILERATDVYRQVENLQQLKAGRMRVLVKGACRIKGGRTSIGADDDVKISGRRIHLG